MSTDRNKRPESQSVLSIRLTSAERERLKTAAGSSPLSAFARAQLFGDEVVTERRSRRRPKADHPALGQVLGMLGQSGLASNLAQLARAANTGALLVDEETRAALNSACADVAAIRAALMQALGMRGAASSDSAPSNPEGPR